MNMFESIVETQCALPFFFNHKNSTEMRACEKYPSLNVHTSLHQATSVFVCLQPDEPDGDEIKSRKADAQKRTILKANQGS